MAEGRPRLSRNDAVEKGERDRPGRSVRRLAEQMGRQVSLTEWCAKANAAGASTGRRRQRSRRARSPSATASFRLSEQAGQDCASSFSRSPCLPVARVASAFPLSSVEAVMASPRQGMKPMALPVPWIQVKLVSVMIPKSSFRF